MYKVEQQFRITSHKLTATILRLFMNSCENWEVLERVYEVILSRIKPGMVVNVIITTSKWSLQSHMVVWRAEWSCCNML